MAKKTFKGRPLLAGELEGKATVSKQPFNTTASYFDNMFAGEREKAPCTDSDNKPLFRKDISNCIMCTSQTIGSTFGGAAIMGVAEMGLGPKAMLFSRHIDSIISAGLFMEDIWNEKRIITIDLLGDDFLEAVSMGDPIKIYEDGTVEVG
jgi:predicted aconitase with swiveling domain